MEWRIRSQLLIVILAASQCLCSNSNIVYYIKPVDSQSVKCPGDPCHSLNVYGTDKPKPPNNNTVTMIFLKGYHSTLADVYNFGSPENSLTLHAMGDSQSSKSVVIDKLKGAITIKNIILENFTALNIYLYIDETVVNTQTTNVSISSCAFVRSALILTNVHLIVKDSTFSDSTSTAIMLFSSTLTIVGHVRFHNNKGFQGGALMLVGTVLEISREANLLFQENHAANTGGAIFVVHPQMMINSHGFYSSCFYQLLDYDSTDSNYSIKFINNSAAKGGDHIYGASLKSGCSYINDTHSSVAFNNFFWLDPGYDSSLSAVAADATRVCICNFNGEPWCDVTTVGLQVYPGEQFSAHFVVVGGDYGTTTGPVYASFFENSTSTLSSSSKYQVITKNSECSLLNFSAYSNESNEILFLTAQETFILSVEEYYTDVCIQVSIQTETGFRYDIDIPCDDTESETAIKPRNVPLFFNLDLLPCPPGFVLSGDTPGCQCHPVLTANGVECVLNHLNGYHSWNSMHMWIQVENSSKREALLFSTHCPFRYCKPEGKHINLSNADNQCTLNRAGILCSGCKANYSLAIGSSRCIRCPNNKNLALLIFFAVAGVLLVLVVAVLNLTVTQGKINGLILYANLIWAYQNILFPSDFGKELLVHKTFIAWLNLDFGIETCFFHGMNAYTKAWLQFAFPFYIAGLFFIGLKNSSNLSTLLGSRSVPTLATLLFLSYSKLLRSIIAGLQLVVYYTYNNSNLNGSINIVWAIDGSYSYARYPHIFLLVAALSGLVLLWMPYTLLLFSMQWLRTIDHLGPFKLIAQYKPLYDAYFAPLKDKHHYWFGLLLLAQGLLLLVSSLTLYILPEISVLLLLAVLIFLLCYVNCVRPYKQMSVGLLESSFLINFIVLAVGYPYFRKNNKGMTVLLCLSITVALVEFCGIIVWNLIPKKLIKQFQAKLKGNNTTELDLEDVHILEEHHSESEYVSYHDSQSIKLANMAVEKAT